MSIHLAPLLAYLVVQVALGLWISRKVTTTGDFFVAGRSLGPGLPISTLVANIGAGSTVGAAGLGYRDGLSAWWWLRGHRLGDPRLYRGPAHPPDRRRAQPPDSGGWQAREAHNKGRQRIER